MLLWQLELRHTLCVFSSSIPDPIGPAAPLQSQGWGPRDSVFKARASRTSFLEQLIALFPCSFTLSPTLVSRERGEGVEGRPACR